MRKRGKFITFEGPEGCGKSTHARLLYNYLRKKGYRCILTREPGGSALGEKIRKILLDPANKGMGPVCETLLFEASRSLLVEKVIIPALSKGIIVISDRFSDATYVYQGFAGKQDLKKLKAIDEYAAGGIMPDLTVVLDIDVREGLKRALRSGRKKKFAGRDRMERKPLRYHKAVRNGYLKLVAENRGRIRLIKTQGDINEAQRLIRQEVLRIVRRA